MTRAYGHSDKFFIDLVETVVKKRAPHQASLISAIKTHSLSASDRETLRETLADELVEFGLGPDDEPNEKGKQLELAIDWLASKAR